MRKFSIVVLAFLATGCGYNRIQDLDEQVSAYRSQIEVQLQRRYDLVPNLVTLVREFAQQEREVFSSVAEARAKLGGAIQSGNLEQMAESNRGLTSALGRLLAIAEAYPELKSNENYRALQDQLEGTENRIAVARTDYNNAVRAHNSYIRRFPQFLTAKAIGADAHEYFEITDEEVREAPQI